MEFSSLLGTILKAVDNYKPQPRHDVVGNNLDEPERLESMVRELSPQKRKALIEILGLFRNRDPRLDDLLERKEIPSFTANKGMKAEDLLEFLLEVSDNKPEIIESDMKYLEKILYDDQVNNLEHDAALNRTIDYFINDLKINKKKFQYL